MGNGYWGKVLRVNLTDRTFREEAVREEVWRKLLGGAGYGAKVLLEETAAKVDPLSPENKIIFGIGCLQSVPAPGSAKWSVITKSPLTKTYLDSAGAGTWAPVFKRTGYDSLIVEGRASEPLYLYITDTGVEFRPAHHLWGKTTGETTSLLKEELGRNVSVLSIGPAGERLVPIACIASDAISFAGRGGAGAVMGAKNLKAIVAYGTKECPVFDRETAHHLCREMMKELAERGAGFSENGTPSVIIPFEEMGDTPIKYWTGDVWPEGARLLGTPHYNEVLHTKPLHCLHCPVGCHRHVRVDGPPEFAMEGNGPEYETIAMLGSNLLIDDLAAVTKANEFCNMLGIDTISAGAWIGFLMECYEKGILTDADLGGPVRWGDGHRMVELVQQIALGEGVGRFFKDGIVGAAKMIGKGTEELIVHVKNLDFPAHDPRAVFGLGVNYATCPIGASHERGDPQATALGLCYPELGWDEPPERFDINRAAEVAYIVTNTSLMYNSLTFCKFIVKGAGMTLTELTDIFNAITGWNWTPAELADVGKRVITVQRLINVRDGIRRKDDVLPPKMYITAKEGGRMGKTPAAEHERVLSEYYAMRGWDEDGVPRRETVEELGLGDLLQYV
ncbi:MAG: aldehyde:ferredoxin oxidoreductase [Bacillota bacterium]|jgi:aldehyde:ferredoxin oxidoreductase|nr:aldehyde:ferredoxin oxidoreductase [Bacillota bacterium]MDK2855404.1 aldehyde:ferredoxin oxidoreductase [Bacillota bacterium]MDK2924462.1 aldehyde:ferredoxin oxidoreductase [Bacillota bacterium]